MLLIVLVFWGTGLTAFQFLLPAYIGIALFLGIVIQFFFQQVAGPKQSGAHGADGYIDDARDLFVGKAFDIAQENHRPEIQRERIDGDGDFIPHHVLKNLFSQVAVAGYPVIIRVVIRDDLIKIDLGRLLDPLPIFVYIGVLEDFKQPCFGISSLFIFVDETEGLHVGLLHQVIRVFLIVRQVVGKGL